MLQRDLRAFFLIEVTPPVTHKSFALLRRHPLRAVDVLHLASSSSKIGSMLIRLAAYDRQLISAASADGLKIVR